MTWVDGRDGLNNEHVMFTTSTDGGADWTDAESRSRARATAAFYSAPAISPDGEDVYLVYNAFLAPYQEDTANPPSARRCREARRRGGGR